MLPRLGPGPGASDLGKIADLDGQRADAVANYRTAREVGHSPRTPPGAAEATRLLRRPFSRPKTDDRLPDRLPVRLFPVSIR